MTKTCTRCRETKDVADFHREKLGKHGVMSVCKVCRSGHSAEWVRSNRERASARMREWRQKNKDKVAASNRRQQLRRNYGMTKAEYDQMLADQDGCCAICRTDTPGGRGTFHVDHDHATGEIRGLLCTRCNTGLGHFRDDPAMLRAALEYLAREAPI